MSYCCQTCEAFKHHIQKCDDEIKKINHGVSQVSELKDVFSFDLSQERLEWVVGIRDTIDFIIKYPDKECIV